MKINVCSLPVEDQEKAVKFYTEVLKFVKKQDINTGDFRWLTIVSPEDPDGVELLLEANVAPGSKDFQQTRFNAGMPIVALRTNDIRADYERLSKLGVVFRGEPQSHGPITAVLFEDTCGNLINLVQPN